MPTKMPGHEQASKLDSFQKQAQVANLVVSDFRKFLGDVNNF